jgi:hypothetical protein
MVNKGRKYIMMNISEYFPKTSQKICIYYIVFLIGLQKSLAELYLFWIH